MPGRTAAQRDIPAAFSLVEVVLALAIATFAVLLIVSLLPVGVRSTQDSLQESSAIDVLSHIIADRQATPLNAPSIAYQIPATNAMTSSVVTFGVTESNTYVAPAGLGQARYRVDYAFTSPTSGQAGPYVGWFRVSWPPSQTAAPAGSVEGVACFAQP